MIGKVNRTFHFVGKRKDAVTLACRERYLREDIPCLAESCREDNCIRNERAFRTHNSSLGKLPRDASHYIIPDAQTLIDYLEIFELRDLITGVIFLQSVLEYILKFESKRLHERIRKLINDSRRGCVVFYNEFHFQTCTDYSSIPVSHETAAYCEYFIPTTAAWYSEHLGGEVPIVVMSDSTMEHALPCLYREGLSILKVSMREYIPQFWPGHIRMHSLFEVLEEAKEEREREIALTHNGHKKAGAFEDHRDDAVLLAGLKSGVYVCGVLHVDRFCSREKAHVKIRVVESEGVSTRDSSSSPLDVDTGQAEEEEMNMLTSQDIVLVEGAMNRNRAIHMDAVYVQVIGKDKNGVSLGKVVGIKSRNWRDCVACVEESQELDASQLGSNIKFKVLCTPADFRIPRIRISCHGDQFDMAKGSSNCLKGTRFVVRIHGWPKDSQYPEGHVLKVLGPLNRLDTEMSAILIENRIDYVDSSGSGDVYKTSKVTEQLRSFENDGFSMPMDKDEIARRRDLRNEMVLSIDPMGSKDVDDALSAKLLEFDKGGNSIIELGVHIADVSHFVKENSFIDLEARNRGTTVYLPDRRFDMVPKLLSENLCSLVEMHDRYCFSVIWRIRMLKNSEDYEVLKVDFVKGIICSSFQLNYEAAQEFLNEFENVSVFDFNGKHMTKAKEILAASSSNSTEFTKLPAAVESVKLLKQLSDRIASKRRREGAIELASQEVRFETVTEGPSTIVKDLNIKGELPIHAVIAECMIFANHYVAKQIYSFDSSRALLRSHPVPKFEFMKRLETFVKLRGDLTIDSTSPKTFAESLQQVKQVYRALKSRGEQNLESLDYISSLLGLATQAMNEAIYFCTGFAEHVLSSDGGIFFHYGLGLDFYTHFTSPIRRYCDIVVHRQLFDSITLNNTEVCCSMSGKEVSELTLNLNGRHRASKEAQMKSSELFLTLYFERIHQMAEGSGSTQLWNDCIFRGSVTGVFERYIVIHVHSLGQKLKMFFISDDTVFLPGRLIPSTERGGAPDGVTESVAGFLKRRSPRFTPSCRSVLTSDGSKVMFDFQNTEYNFAIRMFDHIEVFVDIKYSNVHGNSVYLRLYDTKVCQTKDIGKITPRNIATQVQPPVFVQNEFESGSCGVVDSLNLAGLQISDDPPSMYRCLQDFSGSTR
eukprot:Nk52_evm17s256 gene=Nk52_evmTU17s256